MIPALCPLYPYTFVTNNPGNVNEPAHEALTSRFPSTTAMRLMEHFSQMRRDHRFQDFDYGYYTNMEVYGAETPPEFDLTQITGVPIAVFDEELDYETANPDNEWLVQQIGDIVVFNRTLTHYAHYDLYIAENTTDYLVDVVDLLHEYNQG